MHSVRAVRVVILLVVSLLGAVNRVKPSRPLDKQMPTDSGHCPHT
jgi:hypothetical protein